MRSVTQEAPPSRSASAHAAAVAPVVRTSSTRTTRGGVLPPAGANAPRIALRRSDAERRAWGPVASTRRMSGTQGTSIRRATADAIARDWSKPRSARRRRDSGIQVTTSPAGVSTAIMAAASASATPRHPENFSRWIAAFAGPVYRKGARAVSTDGGGQPEHREVGVSLGRPQRSHQGGSSVTSAPRQSSQKGHWPREHPAQRDGNTASSARASILASVATQADTASGRGPIGGRRPHPQGNGSSRGPRPPRTSITRRACVFRSG